LEAVIYARVSSKEQQEEGYSLPAQRKLVLEDAKKSGVRVVAEFEDVESAKRPGRGGFEKMLAFLRKNPTVGHIFVEKTDRLYRNTTDRVKIEELGRVVHFVKEGKVLGPESRSSEKFIHDIQVAMAKNYSDNLSEETRKGMLEKASQGLYPSYAPLGYVNDREHGGMVIDWERGPLIRRLFEEYAGGLFTLKMVRQLSVDIGLRTRKGRCLTRSSIGVILKNPVYIGDFVWKGVYYKGKHEPLVSIDLFRRVQSIIEDKSRPLKRQAARFAFRGVVKCGTCGCAITAEIKKDRYVYYRCTHARAECVNNNETTLLMIRPPFGPDRAC
jgi:DNA invertase Pin-like site-specific DNA recombinase